MSTNKDQNVSKLLGYKLKQTQHALRLQMDESLRTLDLTTPQYSVLAQLELRPGASNAALARSSFITAQTMHSIISKLEKRNLLKRKKDSEHGRILRTELTKTGGKLLKQAHELVKAVEANMTATMDNKSITLLEKLLSECFSNLNHSQLLSC